MFAGLFNNAETCSFIIQDRHFIFVSHAARFSVFGGECVGDIPYLPYFVIHRFFTSGNCAMVTLALYCS